MLPPNTSVIGTEDLPCQTKQTICLVQDGQQAASGEDLRKLFLGFLEINCVFVKEKNTNWNVEPLIFLERLFLMRWSESNASAHHYSLQIFHIFCATSVAHLVSKTNASILLYLRTWKFSQVCPSSFIPVPAMLSHTSKWKRFVFKEWRMKDIACSLPFPLPFSSGKAEKKIPGTLLYPYKIFDD